MALTPHQRTLRARMAAYSMHAKHDGRAVTQKAREAFLTKFEELVDPTGSLSPRERERRARAARKAHFARMAFLSAKKRQRHDGA